MNNLKIISVITSILVIMVAAMLLMQKGNYVSQAKEHYDKRTTAIQKGYGQRLDYVNANLERNRSLWSLVTEATQTTTTAKQMADLEAKYFPGIKGSNSIAQKTRTFSANSDFYIVSNYAKVETDPKTDVKTLTGLTSISVDALLGLVEAHAPAAEDALDEGAEE